MRNIKWQAWAYITTTFLAAATASASIVGVNEGSFPPGSTTIDFTGVAGNTEVNGLVSNATTFSYLLGEVPTNGVVQIDGGPGDTNHITVPNIVSVGDNSGILRIALPSAVNLFGYGFAVFSESSVLGATTMTAFNGTTSVGSLSFNSVPDPQFAGGFAGISSTLPFNNVELTFDSVQASAFAVDNVKFGAASAVPEPSSALIGLLGFALLAAHHLDIRRR
jgi:hypothetical protein